MCTAASSTVPSNHIGQRHGQRINHRESYALECRTQRFQSYLCQPFSINSAILQAQELKSESEGSDRDSDSSFTEDSDAGTEDPMDEGWMEAPSGSELRDGQPGKRLRSDMRDLEPTEAGDSIRSEPVRAASSRIILGMTNLTESPTILQLTRTGSNNKRKRRNKSGPRPALRLKLIQGAEKTDNLPMNVKDAPHTEQAYVGPTAGQYPRKVFPKGTAGGTGTRSLHRRAALKALGYTVRQRGPNRCVLGVMASPTLSHAVTNTCSTVAESLPARTPAGRYLRCTRSAIPR